jgi:hypothetical protein
MPPLLRLFAHYVCAEKKKWRTKKQSCLFMDKEEPVAILLPFSRFPYLFHFPNCFS